MNFDQLKAFHKVALTGSFTKAARSIRLTQPAVSQQIRSLEHSLGITLFDRSGKMVRMTNEGTVLLSYVERLFNLYEEISTLFESHQSLQHGRIAIGSTNVTGTYFLPKIIGLYNSQYPGIEIDLRLGNSNYVLDRTLEGDVDLGIAGQIGTRSRLSGVLIHRERLLLVSSPEHDLAAKKTVTVDDLVKIPFIWREKGTQNRKVVEEWFKEKYSKNYPRVSIELENVETAKRIVEQGYGITIIPEATVKREIETGLLKSIDLIDLDLYLTIYLFYLKGKVFSKAVKTFLEILSDSQIFSNTTNLIKILYDGREVVNDTHGKNTGKKGRKIFCKAGRNRHH